MNIIRKAVDNMLAPMIKARAEKIGKLIADRLEPGEKVLDLGCGDLTVAKQIQSHKDVQITGVDTVDYNRTDLAFKLYDGHKLPFEDNSFDAVILSFVLHHCENQDEIINEVVRVTRNKVIIFEDTYTNSLGLVLVKFYDFCANKLQDISIACPFKFHNINGWKMIFDQKGLELAEAKNLQTLSINPIKQMLFVVNKKAMNKKLNKEDKKD